MLKKSYEPVVVQKLYSKANKNRIPLSGTFELLPLCNMDCKMCYIKMTKAEQEKIAPLKQIDEWIKLAEEAKDAGMLFLLLTGGEPFLMEGFKELYIALHEMGIFLSVNSNGTMINDDVIEWLVKYPPVRINITLYGASNETYKLLCRYADGFTKVTNAIDKLIEAGISVKLNCSLTPYNKNDLQKMMEFAKNRGLVLEVAAYMFPSIRKNEEHIGKNDRFTPFETARESLRINRLQYGEEEFRKYIELNNFPVLEKNDCIDEDGDIMKCRAGKSAFWVTWDYRLLPCGLMNMPAVDLNKYRFCDAWKMIVNQVDQITLPSKCATCNLKKQCQTCAAMVLAETGNLDEVPIYRCNMMEEYMNMCNVLKVNGRKIIE